MAHIDNEAMRETGNMREGPGQALDLPTVLSPWQEAPHVSDRGQRQEHGYS